MKPMCYESVLKDLKWAIESIRLMVIGVDFDVDSTNALNACESAYDKICKMSEQEDWSLVADGLPQDDEQDYLAYSTITQVYEKVNLTKLKQMIDNPAKITHWRVCPDVPMAVAKLQILPFDPNTGVPVLVDGNKQREVGKLKGYPIFKAPSLKDPKQEILFTEYLAFLTQIGTQTRDYNHHHIELIADTVTHIWGKSGIDDVFDLLG